jgi:hypothetical protein
MYRRLPRILAVVLAPLLLLACVLTPGKFVSTLTVNDDRSFAFAYKGEVYAIDPSGAMSDLGKPGASDDADSDHKDGATKAGAAATAKKAEADAKNRAIAEALAKEAGYRSVAYLGEGRFMIDYAISGKLDHGFVFPFNSDAEAVFPFVMIELRTNNTVRVRAPGYANDSKSDKSGMAAMSGADSAASKLDGVFTLDTNAEIVSQNNEDGAVKAGGRSTIRWRATPLSKDAPAAVLRLAK